MKTALIVVGVVLGAGNLWAGIDMTPYNPVRRPGIYSTTRAEVCLNGVWDFAPVYDEQEFHFTEFPDPVAPPETNAWTPILVPGYFKERAPGYSGMRLPDGKPLPTEWTKAHRGWYRRAFTAPEAWRDKSVLLRFDGVAYYAKVFVNGQPVGEHVGPVTRFAFDVSAKLRFDRENTLDVYVIDKNRVAHAPEGLKGLAAASRSVWIILADQWQYRRDVAGIWKDVFIEARPRVAVDDIYVMPSFRQKTMGGRVWVKNSGQATATGNLVLDVLDPQGRTALEIGRMEVKAPAGEMVMGELSRKWANPKLWDLDEPNLYYLRARLTDAAGKVTDEQLVRFGFKEVWVDKDQIYLNGRIVHALGDWIGGTSIEHLASQRYEYARYWFQRLRADMNFLAPRFKGMSTHQAVFDAADDVGFLLIPTGYSATNFDPDNWGLLEKEWSEYIKAVRNHPCVFIWSQQNESVCHEKSNSLYLLQHRLDMITRELDPLRPYYHDGHAMFVPEDEGAYYENGDLCGTAPISGMHYSMPTEPQSAWLHEFDRWRRRKPMIYGEAGTFDKGVMAHYTRVFFGNERYRLSPDEQAQLEGRVFKMVFGSWRSYAVPGIMALGVFQNGLGYDMKPRPPLELKWNDLTTPGPKITNLGAEWFNPYDPNDRTCVTNAFADWQKRAYAPLLVTLYRDLRHNVFSGEKAEKTACLVNDTKQDQTVDVTWILVKSADGKELAREQERVPVAQGVPAQRTRSFQFPKVAQVEKLKLTVTARTTDGALMAEDEQELSVYPEDPVPALKKQQVVYDPKGELKKRFEAMGVKYRELDEETFKGDARNAVIWIGPYSADAGLKAYYDRLDAWIMAGGLVVVLNQNCNLPGTASANEHCRSLSHPLFAGLADSRIYFWGGRRTPLADNGVPYSFIGSVRSNFVADSSYTLPENGAFIRHLAPVFEMIKGQGCLLGYNLLLLEQYPREPEARLLFHNLLRYAEGFAPRESKPKTLYFCGTTAMGQKLVEAGVPLALTAADQPVSSNNAVIVTPPTAIGGLKDGIVIVESLKELAPCRPVVEGFVERGGIVIALPQDNNTWDAGFGDGRILLASMGRSGSKVDAYKNVEDPLLWGAGTLNGCQYAFVVSNAAEWVRGYRLALPAGADAGRYAVLWKNVGKGKLILSQAPVTPGGLPGSLLANLGASLKQPAPQEYMATFDMVKDTFLEVRPVTAAERKKFHFVNLKHHMNAVFCGKKFDRSMNNVKFRKLPLGEWVYGGGIPFHVVDPDTEDLMGGDPGAPNNCIILKGSRMPVYPPKAEGIKIEKKARRVHFLHTGAWALSIKESVTGGNFDVVIYRLTYADGSVVEVKARDKINIRDWWIKEQVFKTKPEESQLPSASLAWVERNQEATYALATIWAQSWDNPQPDKEIKSLDVISAGASVPLVFAVTLEE